MREQTITVGAFCSPITGEKVSGDQAGHWLCSEGAWLVCLIDGLGHGREAHRAAMACRDWVARLRDTALSHIILGVNEAIRDTRGVAVSLAKIEPRNNRLSYVGVGNVSACLISERVSRMVNAHGIIGNEHTLDIPVQSYDFVAGRDRFVMTSDGVDERIDHASLPLSPQQNAGCLAQQIVTRFRVGRDDASALVVL